MTLTPNKILAAAAVLLIMSITLIISFAPKQTWNPVCYNGYRYNVDGQGVMWPIQTKYGIQRCFTGETDVSK